MKTNNIIETIKKERGGLANIHSAFIDFPEGIEGHYILYKKIMLTDDLPLKRIEREYIASKTSEFNDCPYCLTHHKKAMENHKTENEISKKRLDWFDKISKSISETPWKSYVIGQKMIQDGFSKEEVQHAIMVASYFNFANRLAFAMNLDIEKDFDSTCK